jgi:CspA family cold shock protein
MSQAAKRETGTVKWYDAKKGYGFITPDSSQQYGNDLFVHYTHIECGSDKRLVDGQRVSYLPMPGRNGMQAQKVQPLQILSGSLLSQAQ